MHKTLERRYDLDWLRVLTIFSVFLYHIGMIFVPWDFHIKNAETSDFLASIMAHLHLWRLPLLLFISGAGTILASRKRNTKHFIKERHNRLMIPVVFSMFVIIVPLQVYIEKINQYESFAQFYLTVFDFVPYPNGSLSWHHLWFVLYLFIFSMIALPYMNYLKSDRSFSFLSKIEVFLRKPFGSLFFILPLLISQLILRPYFPEESHDLTDLAYIVLYFLFFLYGMTVCAHQQLWTVIKGKRRHYLNLTLILSVLYYFLYFLPFNEVDHILSVEILNKIYILTSIVLSIIVVITVIAYGQVYLNKKSEILVKLNEGIYPFYILHQTVIIFIGYFVIKLSLGIIAKMLIIFILSLLMIVMIYLLVVKPNSILRICFGMKALKKKPQARVPNLDLTD